MGHRGLDVLAGLDAVTPWHAHVHQDQVRVEVAGLDKHLEAIVGLAHDLEVGLGIEDVREALAKELMVIGQ